MSFVQTDKSEGYELYLLSAVEVVSFYEYALVYCGMWQRVVVNLRPKISALCVENLFCW